MRQSAQYRQCRSFRALGSRPAGSPGPPPSRGDHRGEAELLLLEPGEGTRGDNQGLGFHFLKKKNMDYI